MEKRTFFSDQSERYVRFQGTGSERTVCIRLRTGRYQAERVIIVYQGEFYQMTWEFEKNSFDFYSITLPASESELIYHFQIDTTEGICFYDRAGAFELDRGIYPFRLYPDFQVPEWLCGTVMYQIYVDRYCNGDPSNDVVSGELHYLGQPVKRVDPSDYTTGGFDVMNFCGGDIQGVMDKLDYIKELGVGAIYLNPVFVSPSNHKYDCQDYEHIDPHFGKIVKNEGSVLPDGDTNNIRATLYACRTTDEENLTASDRLFAEFIRKCHEKGIRVILDGVFNHCSHMHRWMDGEKVYGGGKGPDAGAFRNPESKYHSRFSFKNKTCSKYECWWDNTTLPKLNYEDSPELVEEVLRIGEKWVSPPFCADGWRLDVAADLGHSEEFNHTFWNRFRKRVKAANPEAVIIAEHYDDPSGWLTGGEWDTVMNYTAFMEPVSWFFTGVDKHSDYASSELLGNAAAFVNKISTSSAGLPYQSLHAAMNQLDNHDHSRFLTRTNGLTGRFNDLPEGSAEENIRKEVLRQAAVFQFTWPGAPCIYYGDEAGVCGFTDPDNRRPYPWDSEDKYLREFYVKCAALRNRYRVLKNGSCEFILAEDSTVCFVRFNEEEQVYAVFSAAEEETNIDIPIWAGGRGGYLESDRLTLLMVSGSNGYFFEEREVYARYGLVNFTMPPHGVVLLLGR